MVQNGKKIVKMGKFFQEINIYIKNGHKWSKMVKMVKMVQNDPKWLQMIQKGSKWSKIVKNGKKKNGEK